MGVAIGMLHHLRQAEQDPAYKVPRLACHILLEYGQEEREPSLPRRHRVGDQGADSSAGLATPLSRVEGWTEAEAALRVLFERREDPAQARGCLQQFLVRALGLWPHPS